MSLGEIVQVTIDRETKSVSRAGFGTILIVGEDASFVGRLQYYTDLASLAADLDNGEDSEEYKMASVIFSQSPRPERVAIGRIDAGDDDLTDTLNAIVLEQSDFYMVCITSKDADDQALLADWVLANERIASIRTDDIDTISETASNDTLSKCVISFSADIITGNSVDMDVNGVAMATVPFNTDHDTTMDDIVTALDAMTGVDAVLYGDDDNRKIRITKTGANVLIEDALVTGGVSQATITTKYASIGSKLKGESNDRTAVFYHGSSATEYPDAAFLGVIATRIPGSYTGAYKTLRSVSVTELTPTNAVNAHDKNVNTYEEIGEVNVTRYGTTAEGEYVDVMVGVDWTRARIQEEVYSDLVNNAKISYTEAGIATVESAISRVLSTGITNELFSPHAFDPVTKDRIGGYVIVTPTLSSISSQDKAARLLQNITFTAWLSGAIHKVKIEGTVTL